MVVSYSIQTDIEFSESGSRPYFYKNSFKIETFVPHLRLGAVFLRKKFSVEHIWSVLCRTAITDKDRNTLSMIETIEQVNFAAEGTVTGIPFEAAIISMWWRSSLGQPEVGYQRLGIISPIGEDLLTSASQEIDLSIHRRSRNTFNLSGMPFTESGVYRFNIQFSADGESDWTNVASVPIEVIRDFPQ